MLNRAIIIAKKMAAEVMKVKKITEFATTPMRGSQYAAGK